MARVFVAIGSNIDPGKNVREALTLLADRVRIVQISTFYLTGALDRPDQARYCNGVVEIEADIPPGELKNGILRSIESRLGRVRSDDRYAPRTIDLDLILYDCLVVNTTKLVLPDPEIMHRPFVAFPLEELAPDLILPGSGRSIQEITGCLSRKDMEPLTGYSNLLRREILHDFFTGKPEQD
ncbi:MAG: 2-amino-4-hydroxy-6-hydroxymethyldihydropteridine diphosphokinase [Candidatus Latescibacterota bacterium]